MFGFKEDAEGLKGLGRLGCRCLRLWQLGTGNASLVKGVVKQ